MSLTEILQHREKKALKMKSVLAILKTDST